MPGTPTHDQLVAEANRLARVIDETGALNATVNNSPTGDYPEVYYTHDDCDYMVVVTPL